MGSFGNVRFGYSGVTGNIFALGAGLIGVHFAEADAETLETVVGIGSPTQVRDVHFCKGDTGTSARDGAGVVEEAEREEMPGGGDRTHGLDSPEPGVKDVVRAGEAVDEGAMSNGEDGTIDDVGEEEAVVNG